MGSPSQSLQRRTLKAAGCDVIRAEKASGTRRGGRTELQVLLDFLRQGDTLVVTRVDRLARSIRDLQDIASFSHFRRGLASARAVVSRAAFFAPTGAAAGSGSGVAAGAGSGRGSGAARPVVSRAAFARNSAKVSVTTSTGKPK